MFQKSFLMTLIITMALCSIFTGDSFAQKRDDLAIMGAPLADFTLPVYGGGDFKLSDVKGKNVLMVFPRGKYSAEGWCGICMYQYVELVDAELNLKLKDKYNLEVLFVMPFDVATIDKWFEALPTELNDYYSWKTKDLTNATPPEKKWAEYVKTHLKSIVYEKGKVPKPFKLLVDGNNFTLGKRMDIYKAEWSGAKLDQFQPTVILLDTKGNVVYKYMSQHTLDRPNVEYLIKMMNTLL
jgi:peroxiredoxin